jgi:AraC family transcriptional regulator
MTVSPDVVQYEDRFDLVLDYIYEHFDESLDLIRLSEVAGFSPRHWHRVFSAAFGESPSSLVKRVRLQRATVMLAAGQSVRDTAAACGYPDVSSFTRAFRSGVGVSPVAYREGGGHTEVRVARAAGDPERFQVARVDTAPVRCVAMRHRGSYLTIDRTFHDLRLWLQAQAVSPDGQQMYGVYLSDPSSVSEESLESLACMALPEQLTGLLEPLSPEAAVPERYTIRGGSYAVLRHTGAYADMPESYAWLFGCWVPSAGVALDDEPVVERYVSLPRQSGPADMVTELMLPLKR